MIIPLFSLGTKSKSVTVSAQEHVNVFADVSQDADKTPLAFYGMPGLTLSTSFGDTPARGRIPVDDFLYVVHRGTFWEVNNAGVKVSRGTLNTTSGRVQMAYNGLQIGIVDGKNLYIYALNRTAQPIASITNVGTLATLTTAQPHNRYTGETVTISGATPAEYNGTFTITVTGATTFTYTMASNPGASASPVGSYVVASSFVTVGGGLLANPFDITWQDHTFIMGFTGSGAIQWSAVDDGTNVSALDFATAESSPDDLVRCIADHGEVVLFGKNSIEFWASTGNLDQPFSNQNGSELEFGLAAPWSLTKFNDTLIGLVRNGGQVEVRMLQGHTMQKVSSQSMDTIINGYANVADATGSAFVYQGHPMYQINFPSAGASWVYDASTGLWTSMQSGLTGGRHLGEMHVDYLNKVRVFDYQNGNIYNLDQTAYTDNGMPIVRQIVGRHVFRDLNVLRTSFMQIDFETGVGVNDGQGSDPQVMLQVSRDNGHTWGNELWRSMGKIGEYRTRVIWRRLGRGYDFVFKIRMTDPVKFVLAAAAVTNE